MKMKMKMKVNKIMNKIEIIALMNKILRKQRLKLKLGSQFMEV